MVGDKRIRTLIILASLLAPAAAVLAEEAKTASGHAGFLYPNGVDVAGYTAETRIDDHLYRFYTFGVPSFAAVGICYYENYSGNGAAAALGVGIGSIAYASLAYQWKAGQHDYFKLGLGVTTGVAYSGAYPALSYEHRLAP